jgi:hypothetical protein
MQGNPELEAEGRGKKTGSGGCNSAMKRKRGMGGEARG